MDVATPPLVSGSTSRLDCLLDIWDSLLMQNRATETQPKTEADTKTHAEARIAKATVRETEREAGRDAVPYAESRLSSPKDAPMAVTFSSSVDRLGGVRDAAVCTGGKVAAPPVPNAWTDTDELYGERSAFLEDGQDDSPSDLEDVGPMSTRGWSSSMSAGPPNDPVNSTPPPTVIVMSDAGGLAVGYDCSVDLVTRETIPPDSLSVALSDPLSEPLSSPLSDPFSSPLSESRSTPPSASLSPPPSELSAPLADSGVSEAPTDESPSSLDLSIAGESALSGGGDSTGDETARGSLIAGGRRAPRWRAAELRQRPLSVVSTTSSSSSSGGGSLPRCLARRRPPRPARNDVTDSADRGLLMSAVPAGLPRTRSLQLDTCVTQADRVVAEIVQTEAVYVSDLREVIEGYLLYRSDNPSSGIQDEHKDTLFGNYRQIYSCNRVFLSALERCGSDPLRVAKCFVGHQQRFEVYTEYCTHYPRAMTLLTELLRRGTRTARLLRERQAALRHTLPLGSYLLKPVQRILKYHLLLQSLMTHSMASPESQRRATAEALRTMRSLAGHIDDMKRRHESAVRVQEVQSLVRLWQGDELSTFGELLAEDTFRVPRARVPRQVFLFEKMLFITKKRDDGTLVYKTHILCSNLMLIESVPGEVDSLQVLPFDDPREQYTLQARSVECKRQWAQRLKVAILESYGTDIPKHARELVMKLGQHRENGEALRRKMGRRTHSVPEYLERRRSVKRAASAAGSVQQTAGQQRQQRQRRLQAGQLTSQWELPDRLQLTPGPTTVRRITVACSPAADCSWPAPGAPSLPDVDEEELEEPSRAVRSSPHPSSSASNSSSYSSSSAASADATAAGLEEDHDQDVQTIVEQLVLQNKHFQRVMEKPRREVRRSPTSSSESPSERSGREPDSDSCQEETGLPPLETAQTEVPSPVEGQERAAVTTSGDGEGVVRPPGSVEHRDAMPELMAWRGDTAITIESRDNVHYVSLFDYGARPVSAAGLPPPPVSPPPPERAGRRGAVERTVSEPCRRVARRLTRLHQNGQAELRQIVGGIRNRSLRLSRHFEDNARGSTQQEELREGGNAETSTEAVPEETSRTSPSRTARSRAETGRRSTWYCEASDPLDTIEPAQKAQSSERLCHQQQENQPQQQRQPQPKSQPQRSQLKSFGSFRVLMRRSGGAGSRSGGTSRWRPLTQLFEPSKSRQRPPFASEAHAMSLQRLPTSDEPWQQPAVSSARQSPPLAAEEVRSVTSLPTAESRKFLPGPLDGGVRRLREKLAGLVAGAPSGPLRPAEDLLGARLASSQLIESPLLTERRHPLVRGNAVSMTSLASSRSSASYSGSENEYCCDSGFYETGMEILENIGVEVCF